MRGSAVASWYCVSTLSTIATGQTGDYVIGYLASDGSRQATRSARIHVDSAEPPAGPATPLLVAPLAGAEVAALRPQFSVQTSEASNDPTQSVQFELYRDAGLTDKLDEITLAEQQAVGQPTI